MMPRKTAEELTDVDRRSPLPRGGHFAPAAVPERVVDDLRGFFGLMCV